MKTKSFKSILILSFLFVSLFSFPVSAQTARDVNGNVYKTIKYGMQEWMASNLNVMNFRNGDKIPEAKTKEEWIQAGKDKKPVWCFYNNDPSNGAIYGKLYNWYAINDPRGLAPEGWRIPENNDWRKLIKNLLGVDYGGAKLKSITGWKSKNGSDKIGFTALPAGIRDSTATFNYVKIQTQWWSNSEPVSVLKSDLIYSVKLNDYTLEIAYIKMQKESGLSVRCMK